LSDDAKRPLEAMGCTLPEAIAKSTFRQFKLIFS
jgi:hypothetical protein